MTTPHGARSARNQVLPDSGLLAGNLDLDRGELARRIDTPHGAVHCYIVRTVASVQGRFIQSGSAPNFQGDFITLCTCKWRMRAGKDVGEWEGVWIAGIAGANAGPDGRDHLFYLMRVGQAFASHRDLATWLAVHAPGAAREKAADQHRLGDLYRPDIADGNPYDPHTYISPRKDHVHRFRNPTAWHKDINDSTNGRRPALLIGDPKYSFLWSEPRVHVPFRMGIGYKLIDLNELLA